MAEQRYYWLRLKRDFFKRHDIRIIESMPNGKDYLLFYLKLLCESVDHDGNLRFSDQIPYSEEMLSTITNTNIDIVRSAINIFTQLGMMDILDDGTIFMNEVTKLIGSAVDNDNANRQRRFREKQKELALQERYECVTKNNESKSNSKNKSKSNSKSEIKTLIEDFGWGDEEFISAFIGFVEMRKSIKKPLTERAMKMILNKLEKLADDMNTRIAILNQSVLHSWQDVYEFKTENKTKEIAPVVVTEDETERLLRLTKGMQE